MGEKIIGVLDLQFFLGACGAHDVALPNVLRNGGHEPLVNVSVAFEEVLGARRHSTPSATLLPVNGICPDRIRSLTDESPRRMKRTVECGKGEGLSPVAMVAVVEFQKRDFQKIARCIKNRAGINDLLSTITMG